jgi:hypothetical protein
VTDRRQEGAPEPAEADPPGELAEYLHSFAAGLVTLPEMNPELLRAAGALSALELGPDQLRRIKGTQHEVAGLAVRLRADAVIAYWAPLLPLCQEGMSRSPVADLKSVAAEAHALAEAAEPPKDHALTELAAQLDGWLPQELPPSLTAPRFDRPGGPHPPAGEPIVAPPKADVESPPGDRRLILILMLAGLLLGVGLGKLAGRIPEASVDSYRAAVPEVVSKHVEGDALVVVVRRDWATKEAELRLSDLDRIEATVLGEPINRIIVQDITGQLLGQIDEDGMTLIDH